MRECEIEISNKFIKILLILKKHYGKWAWNIEEEVLDFDKGVPDSVVEEVDTLHLNIEDIAGKQIEAEKRMRGLR